MPYKTLGDETHPMPHTPNIHQAARYWDTHSVTDENSEPVSEPIILRKPIASAYTIRLEQDDVAKLRAIARANGVGATAMARQLLLRAINDHD